MLWRKYLQTSTFCGRKNIKHVKRYVVDKDGMCTYISPAGKGKKCKKCGEDICRTSKLCKACESARRKKNFSPHTQLQQDIASMSMEAVGRKYKVTGNAVRKWIKYYEKENHRGIA